MIKRHVTIVSKVLLLVCVGIVLSFPVIAAAAEKGGAKGPTLLPDELKGFSIKDAFVPLDANVIGTIQSVKGILIVRHGRRFTAYSAAPGDHLYEHDILYTLTGSSCRVRFVTADIITVGENSRISVDQLVDDRKAKQKRSLFGILRGKAMFYVVRLFRYTKVIAEVRTPTAVTGVRGTKFGVKVVKADDKMASARHVYLADASGGMLPGLLAQNTVDEGIQTIVYGFEGEVTVTSTADGMTQTLAAGQNVVVGPTGAGQVTVTPPVEARQFSKETDAPPPPSQQDQGRGDAEAPDSSSEPGEGTKEGAEPEGSGETTTDKTTTVATYTDAKTGFDDPSQNLTSKTIQPEAVPGKAGYFAALLTRYDGNYNLADVYTNASRSNFDGGELKGDSIVDGLGGIKAVGTDVEGTTPYITQIKTDAGGPMDSGDLGTTRQMDNDDNTPGWPVDDELGSNNYMKWGFWRMSNWVQPGGAGTPSFAVTDRAYYIEGVSTPDDAVAGIVGTYAGAAYGTYFDGNKGVDMVGDFSCDVNVPANSVTTFNLSVSGGGKFANINQGNGNFIGTSGEFKITGGTWNLMGGPAVSKSLQGSLYGPAGEHIGGTWAMDAGAGNNAAVGIFKGDKGGAPAIPALPPAIPGPPAPPP
ncbi:FecR domain-containing protein [Thermodesulfobacteriota bacterium]